MEPSPRSSRFSSVFVFAGLLTDVIAYVEDRIKPSLQTDMDVLRSVRKLDDHVELEFRRMQYQIHQNSTLHKNIEQTTNRFTEQVTQTAAQLNQEFQQRMKEASQTTQKDFQESVRKVEEKSQRNYVSVLGIFISLVTAFSAGIRLSSEIVETIVGMSVYRTAGILLALGLGVGDLVLTLLYFVLVVSGIGGGSRDVLKKIAKWFNVVMALLLVVVIVARVCHVFG